MEKQSFEELLVSEDVVAICKTMVELVFDPNTDISWFEPECISLLTHAHEDVRGLAATCLGHIARHTGTLSSDALKALRSHISDPLIGGRVQDALDDWQQFANCSNQAGS